MENRIKEIRKLRQMTQQELADKVGVSQVQIGRLEKSTRTLDVDMLADIAEVLNVEVWELLPKEMQPNITAEEMEVLRAIRKAKEVTAKTEELSSTNKAS
jgi:transcriptional regulator with XRE-family HTH domain